MTTKHGGSEIAVLKMTGTAEEIRAKLTPTRTPVPLFGLSFMLSTKRPKPAEMNRLLRALDRSGGRDLVILIVPPDSLSIARETMRKWGGRTTLLHEDGTRSPLH